MAEKANKRVTRIIGHKNPDTDSICSAIAYSYLKNQISDEIFEPRRAGDISRETAFVLNHFGVDVPRISADLRPNIRNIDIREEPGVNGQMTMRAAWQRMNDRNVDTLAITNEGERSSRYHHSQGHRERKHGAVQHGGPRRGPRRAIRTSLRSSTARCSPAIRTA